MEGNPKPRLSADTVITIVAAVVGIFAVVINLDWISRSALDLIAAGLVIYGVYRHHAHWFSRLVVGLIALGLLIGFSWHPIWDDFHKAYPMAKVEPSYLIAFGLIAATLCSAIAAGGYVWGIYQTKSEAPEPTAPVVPAPASSLPQKPGPLLSHKYTSREARNVLDAWPQLTALIQSERDLPIPADLYAIPRRAGLPPGFPGSERWQDSINKLKVTGATEKLLKLQKASQACVGAIMDFMKGTQPAFADDLAKVLQIMSWPHLTLASSIDQVLQNATAAYMQRLSLLQDVPPEKLTIPLIDAVLSEQVTALQKAANDHQRFYYDVLNSKLPVLRRELENFL